MLKKLKRWLIIAAAVLAGSLTGCCSTVPKDYMAADRARYETIGLGFAAYVRADESLSPEAREARLRNVRAWGYAFGEAEPEGQRQWCDEDIYREETP